MPSGSSQFRFVSPPPNRPVAANCPQENPKTTGRSPTTSVYSTHRVQILKMTVLVILIMALLSAPLYPLYMWTDTDKLNGRGIAMILGLQCGCALLFGTVLAACTKARWVEIITACSA